MADLCQDINCSFLEALISQLRKEELLILITNQTFENITVFTGYWNSPHLHPGGLMKKSKNYSLARITQPVVILALFLIFLKLFAWDAWARFSRDDVQVQMRKEEDQTLNTPAVTICMDHVRIN